MEKSNSQMHKLSQCKREIEMEVPALKVQEEFQGTVKRFSQKAKVKGFRPGKVPGDIVKRMYYQDIKEAVINTLIPEAINQELRAQNLSPVGSPVVTELSFQENQPLKFKARFEVWPEFELPEYKKIEVDKTNVNVSAEDVNHSLKDLQTRSAQYMPTEDRGIVDGDYVITEIQSQDIATQKALPKEKVVILAGHAENEKLLNKNLLGMKVDEEKNFTINYPQDHQNKKLAGKDIAYSIKVLSIKEKKLPEINDDFAKELGEFKNLEELKARLKSELHASKESAAQREMSEEIVKKIADKMTFELPETLVEEESLALLRRYISSQPQHVQQSLSQEDLKKMKENLKPKAEQNLKNHLLLMKIAEKENLTVMEKDVNDELNRMARVNNVPLAKLEENMDKEELKNNLLIRKTVDFLVDNAIIKET